MDFTTALEEEIVKCGKSSYLDIESKLTQYKNHLAKKYPFIETYVGEKPIMGNYFSWALDCASDSKVLNYLKSIIESGISNYYSNKLTTSATALKRIPISRKLKDAMFKSNKYYQRLKRLDLESSVNTLFILLLLLLAACCCVFLGENVTSR